MSEARILVVDDEPFNLTSSRSTWTRWISTWSWWSPRRGLGRAEDTEVYFDLVLLDRIDAGWHGWYRRCVRSRPTSASQQHSG